MWPFKNRREREDAAMKELDAKLTELIGDRDSDAFDYNFSHPPLLELLTEERVREIVREELAGRHAVSAEK